MMEFYKKTIVPATEGNSHIARLDYLTSLRAFAAMAVLLHHATRDLVQIPIVSNIFRSGFVGVSLFFILSGFVLTWATQEIDTKTFFYIRRFARVYPLHILTLTATIFLIALSIVPGADAIHLVLNVLLLQAWGPSNEIHYAYNSVSWSLSCEAFFYAIFPFIVNFRIFCVLSPVIFVSIATIFSILASIMTLDNWEATYTNPLFGLIFFATGISLAQMLKRGLVRPVSLRFALAICVAGYVAPSILARTGTGLNLSWPLSCSMLLPGWSMLIISLAQKNLSGIRVPFLQGGVAIFLGSASFALYMSHLIILNIFDFFVPQSAFSTGMSISLLILYILICQVSAAIIYQFFELPLEKKIRRWGRRFGGAIVTDAPLSEPVKLVE